MVVKLPHGQPVRARGARCARRVLGTFSVNPSVLVPSLQRQRPHALPITIDARAPDARDPRHTFSSSFDAGAARKRAAELLPALERVAEPPAVGEQAECSLQRARGPRPATPRDVARAR